MPVPMYREQQGLSPKPQSADTTLVPKDHTSSLPSCTWALRGLPYAVHKFAMLAGSLLAIGTAWAGPAFITTPPAITPGPAPVQAAGPLRPSVDMNQAAMSQIINTLNQRQFQLSVANAQTTVQRPIFVPQRVIIKRAK